LRSLQNDPFRGSLIAVGVALVLLIVWAGWFFGAQVTIYEHSADFTLQRDGSLAVRFNTDALARLQPGQAAYVEIQSGNANAPDATRVLPALVMDVPFEATGPVIVALLTEERLTTPQGTVQIEVEYVSPAMLVLRSAGQFVNDPRLALSPQK
jgi:hypothetical protein